MVYSFAERAQKCYSSFTKEIFETIAEKQSMICASCFLPTMNEIITFADTVGPHIVFLRLSVQMIMDFDYSYFVPRISQIAINHRFYLFEDRMFADIGKITSLQYTRGAFRFQEWIHIVTSHMIYGEKALITLKRSRTRENRGCILFAQSECPYSLINKSYTDQTIDLCRSHPDFVIGLLCTRKLVEDEQVLHFFRNIRIPSVRECDLEERVMPIDAVKKGCDVLILDSAIAESEDPVYIITNIKEETWVCYEDGIDECIRHECPSPEPSTESSEGSEEVDITEKERKSPDTAAHGPKSTESSSEVSSSEMKSGNGSSEGEMADCSSSDRRTGMSVDISDEDMHTD